MVKRKEIFLFVLLLLMGISFIYMYSSIKQIKDEIYSGIEENKIKNITYLFKNIEKDLHKYYTINNSEDIKNLLADKQIRKEHEHSLSLLLTPSIKYIYILQRDKKNRFRFLLDASKTDKANFYQKFDVHNPKYEELFTTKLPQIIKQDDMENLYLTYLYPIIVKNEIIAVLSVDITSKIHNTIQKLIKPLETFFIVLILLLTVAQIFHYFITRKKIFTDPLTQLFNRNYLQEILPRLNLKNYSIAMLDLDKFKIINDTYGHNCGDFVLSQSAEIFKKSIRDTDILIRYGGEEFLLCIYKRDEITSASEICERIRINIDNHLFIHDTHEIKVAVSIGIHENPEFEKNINEAIKITDKMLYQAKNTGRNRVVIYNEILTNRSLEKSKDINFVKHAINEERVVCHYQAIYDYHTNKILKYEALVRIIDEDDSIVYPMEFLPGLIHTNIHYKLTQKILSIVFDKFSNIKESVSININFSDLINNDIEETILKTLKANPSLAKRVSFEILESDEIENISLFKEKINLLHSLGSKVSIDDFGSGYSNFKTILDIEANYLKIDSSLIKNIDKNEKDFKVVKSIIHFAKEANLKTIAEFVHSKEVYDKLLELDLDYMQGYYIDKPSAELKTADKLFQEEISKV